MNEQTSIPFRWRSPFDFNHPAGGMLSGMVAGLIAGVITAIAARFVMRVVALILGAAPIFTVDGTLVILKDGAVFGTIVGIIFGFFQPFFSGSVIKKGAKYGLFLSAVMVVLLYASREIFGEAPLLVILLLFAILPILYGVMLGWIIIQLIPTDQINGNAFSAPQT